MEVLKDSFSHRYFTVRFNGRKPPIRPRIILSDLKLRPRKLSDTTTIWNLQTNLADRGSSVRLSLRLRRVTLQQHATRSTLTCRVRSASPMTLYRNQLHQQDKRPHRSRACYRFHKAQCLPWRREARHKPSRLLRMAEGRQRQRLVDRHELIRVWCRRINRVSAPYCPVP